ncbi:hypothetical protein [Pseudoteredinibacter isoporae]|uniref:Uncharacterized protein n=1 Tax=Pseudoteredinibacter isoporae TaxID=570281 RepID=A0A7X0JY69_9GAMM|nr:hypothetical protein [Pseudoteredinibacter isoporae]MBB6523898.1 hypothetical protein [Pseudoteredinibacter isoporae]
MAGFDHNSRLKAASHPDKYLGLGSYRRNIHRLEGNGLKRLA